MEKTEIPSDVRFKDLIGMIFGRLKVVRGHQNDKRKTWHIDHIVPHSSFCFYRRPIVRKVLGFIKFKTVGKDRR